MVLLIKNDFTAASGIFTAALLACFLAISCGPSKALVSAPGEMVSTAPAESPVSADAAEGELADPRFALAGGETRDTILAVYRDELFRDRVVDFFRKITGSRDLASAILANTALFDIPPALAFSLCWEESRYNPRAVNRKNRNRTVDRGLFQLNSASFPRLKEDEFFNIEINSRYGLSHLRWCLDTAGTEVAGLAMYNAGTVRVRSGGTPKITLDYISRILDRKHKIEELFLAEYERITWVEEEETPPLDDEKAAGIRLSLLAPLGRR